MDSLEKKPKRPRIGQVRGDGENTTNYDNSAKAAGQAGEGPAQGEGLERTYRAQSYQPRRYQRPYNQDGGYNRQGQSQGQGGYNRQGQGGYNRPQGQRPQGQGNARPAAPAKEGGNN